MTLGPYLVFGVVLLPLYLVLAGWFLGEPRDASRAGLGVFFLVGIALSSIVVLWLMGVVLSVIMSV